MFILKIRLPGILPQIVFVAALALASASIAEEPQVWLAGNLEGLQGLYREFHSHPELSFEEEKDGRAPRRRIAQGGRRSDDEGRPSRSRGPFEKRRRTDRDGSN